MDQSNNGRFLSRSLSFSLLAQTKLIHTVVSFIQAYSAWRASREDSLSLTRWQLSPRRWYRVVSTYSPRRIGLLIYFLGELFETECAMRITRIIQEKLTVKAIVYKSRFALIWIPVHNFPSSSSAPPSLSFHATNWLTRLYNSVSRNLFFLIY